MENEEKGTEVKTGLTAEEKENQIDETVEKEEGKPLTEEEEFKILKGQGIEFKADKLIIIIPPIKLKQINVLHQIENDLKDEGGDANEKFNKAIEAMSSLLGVSVEQMGDNLYTSDLFIIMRLLIYSVLFGRRLYEKDSVKKKDIMNVNMKNLI